MIILDTNVVSEVMRSQCNPAVTLWFNRRKLPELHLTSIGLAELLFGVATVPEGRRKRGLLEGLALLRRSISPVVLPFDEAESVAYADLMARTRRKGITVSEPDGQIAAIAAVHRCAVATRDVEPFLAAGITVIDPFAEV